MPTKNAVLWVNSNEDYNHIIDQVLGKVIDLKSTDQWFYNINNFPKDASCQILKNIKKIILNN